MTMRVLLLSENKETGFSGGRYHVLMLGLALIEAGHAVTYQTPVKPGFAGEFADHPGFAGLDWHVADRFSPPEDARFDLVILAPGRAFRTDLYYTARFTALRSGAELVLLNFESANWYNAVSPNKRDPAEWSHWREAMRNGGTVLSSAQESLGWARKFYPRGCRHLVWSPPIHARAADAVPAQTRGKRIALITRFDDAHKGAARIEALLPPEAAGHTLALMTASMVSQADEALMRERLAARQVDLDLIRAPDEGAKFRELKRAKALLFPSRFEGYGLPPIEALYCGAEVACHDLPVIRETCGALPHFSAAPNETGLSNALGLALRAPDRAAALHSAVRQRADFGAATEAIAALTATLAAARLTAYAGVGGRIDIAARAEHKALRRVRALRTKAGRARVLGRLRRLAGRLPPPEAAIETAALHPSGILNVSGFALGPNRPDRGEVRLGALKAQLEINKARPDLLLRFPLHDEAYGGFSGEVRVPEGAGETGFEVVLWRGEDVLHRLFGHIEEPPR